MHLFANRNQAFKVLLKIWINYLKLHVKEIILDKYSEQQLSEAAIQRYSLKYLLLQVNKIL